MTPRIFPGEALRERREALGLSLQQVHEQVHVPLQHLANMEKGDVAALPLPTYTTGFISSYCEFLGLTPDPFLHRYRWAFEQLEDAPAAAAEPAPRVAPKQFTMPAPRYQRPAWVADALTWGAICGIVLLGWVTYSVVLKPAAVDETRVEAGTFDAPRPPEFHFLEDELK
jgi:cytoskeletal protein RodZ